MPTTVGDQRTEISGFPDRTYRQVVTCRKAWRVEMAYDEELAERVRDAVEDLGVPVTERKMFGGLAFMLRGHMFTGIVGDDLMVRLGADGAAEALRRRHVREMDFTGRPMKGMVFVEPGGTKGKAVSDWVGSAAAFAQTLPPK